MSDFIISSFNTYMFYQMKRTELLEFIPLIDVSMSIGTVEYRVCHASSYLFLLINYVS